LDKLFKLSLISKTQSSWNYRLELTQETQSPINLILNDKKNINLKKISKKRNSNKKNENQIYQEKRLNEDEIVKNIYLK
jgi:hypothetical protein